MTAKRGRCPVCGLFYMLSTTTGMLTTHHRWAGWGVARPKCKGSGQPPLPAYPRVLRPRKIKKEG
jgi:hypothetical protein